MKHFLIALTLFANLLAASAQYTPENKYLNSVGDSGNDLSGEYYDYTKTMAPERPYIHRYDQTLTMKMALAYPDGKGGSHVVINFEQALQKIIRVDNITRGIPKIIYLVSWQYNGHDDKYPAWYEVNAALKRPQDVNALESFYWLKREALKYHTTISVHINMQDCYRTSPLWDTYEKNDLIARNTDGSYLLAWPPEGYQVCYTREWASGFAQKRIDYVVDMLHLQSAGTVHIDAFFPRKSDYHSITQDMETQAMRKIYRYWRNKGVDVTSECQAHLRPDPFIGLQPMGWHFDLSREQRVQIPPQLACGGMPGMPWDKQDPGIKYETGFLFGQSMQGEDLLGNDHFIPEFAKQFCTTTLQFYYQNQQTLARYDKENKTTTYKNGLVMDARDWTVRENGRLLRSGSDVFFPAGWQKDKEILAFSEKGYTSKTWTLPPDWRKVKAVDVYTVTENGLALKAEKWPVIKGQVTLSLEPGEEVSIQPGISQY